MNVYHKICIAVGILLCLMPFIALPYAWKGWIAAVCGGIVILSVMMHERNKAL